MSLFMLKVMTRFCEFRVCLLDLNVHKSRWVDEMRYLGIYSG